MAALLEPGDALVVGLARLRREDVHRVARLVVAQLAQRPEGVRQRAGGDEQDPAARRGGDAVRQRAAEPQVVLHVAGLADPDGHPPLVGQALAEELPEVDGGVVDRQVLVLDRGDPGAVLVGELLDVVGQFGIAGEVVRHPAHAARQLLGGEQTGAALLGGDDELDGGRPVGVQDDDGVVVVARSKTSLRSWCRPVTRVISLPSFSSSRVSSGSTMVGTWARRPAPTISPMVVPSVRRGHGVLEVAVEVEAPGAALAADARSGGSRRRAPAGRGRRSS